MRKQRPEELVHRAIADYLRIVAPINHFWWAHYPAGGARTPAEGGIFKAMGVVPGVADILVIPHGGIAHWLEVKAAKGGQSESQKAFAGVMIALGCPYAVVRAVDEADTMLRQWGVVRASAA
jgi:hypothetical protein